MATLSEVRNSIYTYFIDQWGATSEFTFDNEKFNPPNNTKWVRVSVRHRTSTQDTLGSVGTRQYERRGAVIIQVFTPLNGGTAEADSLVQTLQTMFEGVNIGEANVYEVPITEIGPSEEFYRVDVEALFVYNETK